ncbi:hypothetical protein TNCV_1504091 [Trichonephila clavipes]|uniref:Uncharacterized protein n=1 Tax=Trichonephila clavipes TaxID=2585209 RepID=A0A8X6V4C3_TRICX|nr:hypothetical protein TNCV_1504091 [Trichonephila clavipes]
MNVPNGDLVAVKIIGSNVQTNGQEPSAASSTMTASIILFYVNTHHQSTSTRPTNQESTGRQAFTNRRLRQPIYFVKRLYQQTSNIQDSDT